MGQITPRATQQTTHPPGEKEAVHGVELLRAAKVPQLEGDISRVSVTATITATAAVSRQFRRCNSSGVVAVILTALFRPSNPYAASQVLPASVFRGRGVRDGSDVHCDLFRRIRSQDRLAGCRTSGGRRDVCLWVLALMTSVDRT